MPTLKATSKTGPKTKPRDTFTRALAVRLKHAREKAQPKLSQDAVGRLFAPAISRASVSQWEDAAKGTTPDLAKLVTLARAYGVSIDWLLTGEQPRARMTLHEPERLINNGATPSPEVLELAKQLSSLPEVKKRLYRDLIEWDCAILDAFPAMKDALVVLKPTYHEMTERFSKAEAIRQASLKFDP